MEGGPSAIDTFDRNPALNDLAANPFRPVFNRPIPRWGQSGSALLASNVSGSARQSGLLGFRLAAAYRRMRGRPRVIRSCHADGINHSGGVLRR